MFDFKGAAFRYLALASCWFGENIFTVIAGYDGLGMTKYNI